MLQPSLKFLLAPVRWVAFAFFVMLVRWRAALSARPLLSTSLTLLLLLLRLLPRHALSGPSEPRAYNHGQAGEAEEDVSRTHIVDR